MIFYQELGAGPVLDGDEEPAAADHDQTVPPGGQVSAAAEQVQVVDTHGYKGSHSTQKKTRVFLNVNYYVVLF